MSFDDEERTGRKLGEGPRRERHSSSPSRVVARGAVVARSSFGARVLAGPFSTPSCPMYLTPWRGALLWPARIAMNERPMKVARCVRDLRCRWRDRTLDVAMFGAGKRGAQVSLLDE